MSALYDTHHIQTGTRVHPQRQMIECSPFSVFSAAMWENFASKAAGFGSESDHKGRLFTVTLRVFNMKGPREKGRHTLNTKKVK